MTDFSPDLPSSSKTSRDSPCGDEDMDDECSPLEQLVSLPVIKDELHPVIVKWSGKEISVATLSRSATILQLKELLCDHTSVLPHRQKLLGGGRAFTDDLTVGEIFKPYQKIMMMGSPEAALASILQAAPENQSVVNDLEILEDVEIPMSERIEYLAKIERRVASYEVEMLGGFREGKKLLVLDIDYTIFDNGSVGQSGYDLMRPFLHEFLHIAYRNYDIIVWSATGKRWINAKLQELGIRANAAAGHYRIAAVLDSAAMISVQSSRGQLTTACWEYELRRLQTAPIRLGKKMTASEDASVRSWQRKTGAWADDGTFVIVAEGCHRIGFRVRVIVVPYFFSFAQVYSFEGKFPQFSEKNTLIVDDLRHNFIMNPGSGLRISKYRRAFENRDKDTELVKLAEYLEAIATLEDFCTLEGHKKWKYVAQDYRRKLRQTERAKRHRSSSSNPGGDRTPDGHARGS